jgi:hypothetical protein
MQQLNYQKSPYVPLVYPQWLEAYNTRDWTGWVRSPAGDGTVFYTEYNIDTFLYVHPVPATTGGGGGSTGLWVAIAVVVIAGLGVVLVVRRRGGRRTVEEA